MNGVYRKITWEECEAYREWLEEHILNSDKYTFEDKKYFVDRLAMYHESHD